MVDVTTWDIDKDESSSNLWLLSTDGKTQKQLTNTAGKNSGPQVGTRRQVDRVHESAGWR